MHVAPLHQPMSRLILFLNQLSYTKQKGPSTIIAGMPFFNLKTAGLSHSDIHCRRTFFTLLDVKCNLLTLC